MPLSFKVTPPNILIGLIGLCAVLAGSLADAANTIRVGGTGSMSAVMEMLIESHRQVHPEANIDIVYPPMGSSAGIRAVSAGFLDLAISGRPPRPEEESALAVRAFARSPLAFVVNGVTELDSLSSRQVIDIYHGKTPRWKDGTPLRLVLRPASDADAALLKSLHRDMQLAVDAALQSPGAVVATQDMENLELLSKTKGQMGTVTLCQLRAQKSTLRPVALDGNQPTLQNLASGTYPLVKQFFVVTRKAAPEPLENFIKFLYSDRARRILAENGCQPVAK